MSVRIRHIIHRAVCGATLALVLTGGPALAAPLPAGLSASGGISFSTGDALVSGGGGGVNGQFGTIVGGSGHYTSYSGALAQSPNPRNATFVDIGDGLIFFGDGNLATQNAELVTPIDFNMTVENQSATTTFIVTFAFLFDHFVDADGSDAFVESEYTVDEASPVPGEAAFTEIVSDTVFGDEVGGIKTGTFGARQSDLGTLLFDRTLAPGQSVMFEGAWTAEIGVFNSVSSGTFGMSGSFTIGDVRSYGPPAVVPLPAGLPLLIAGLGGLAALATRRRRPAGQMI